MMLPFADLRRANPSEELAAAAIILAAGRMRGGRTHTPMCAGWVHDAFIARFRKEKIAIKLLILFGSPGWIRTSDHSINSRMLYR
jgi:hypothetical protein